MDTAGQVTESQVGSRHLTTAGVVFLPETLVEARAAIPTGLPKWRDAQLADIQSALTIVSSLGLVAFVLRTDCDPKAWQSFWGDAKEYHREFSQRTRGSGSFAKAGNIVRFFQFGECSARALGETVKRVGLPGILDASGLHRISGTIVCDTDIQGAENIAMFNYLWDVLESSQALLARIGLSMATRSVELKTEQEEPLLLLSDHLAGAAHTFCSSGSVAPPPGLSASDLAVIGRVLQTLPNRAYHTFPFDIPYREIFGDTKIGRFLWPAS